MFQKQTFGASTSAFGTSTTPSFGSFKPTTGTNAFGAPPAFGATATAQPSTGGGLFGSTNTTGGGLFGSTTAPSSAPAFGSTSGSFGFGANTSSGGLFGGNQSTSLFGSTQNTSAFGAKPAGFGFGSTSTTGTTGSGLFGSTPSTSTGLFGQQNTTLGGGGLFNNTGSAFGQQQVPTGTGQIKYNPVVGTDVVVKSGNSQNVNIKHHCITCMKEYEGKSLEELRLEDYTAGRKGATGGGMFTGFQQQPTENKPLFGGSTFGQPATSTATLFGGGGTLGTSGFGQTNTFSFGGNTQNQTTSTGLFGNKPAFGATSTTGTGIFGAASTQAPTFGTTTSTFGGFGTSTQNQNTGLLFGKPATSGFGSTPASTGFGGFGTGLFNAKPQQTTAPTFGASAPSAFGTLSSGFGTNTSSTGFFGNLAKPNTTPMLGGQTQNTGFGTGLGTGLGSSFQAKPTAPAFGNLGTGSIFQQPQANNTFRTGLDSGLGNSMFGTTPSLGTGLSLGGFNANITPTPIGGSAAGGGVHEQILTLAARPYGDSPLFKDLLPETGTTAEEALKPTNPAALKAALESSYKVASPTSGRLRVVPRPTIPSDKKSLFDGLEESDATLEDKLSMKPSRKRLVLRPGAARGDARDPTTNDNRSMEEHPVRNGEAQPSAPAHEDAPQPRPQPRNEVNDSVTGSDKLENWLSGSKVSWPDREKPVDGEATPRLYPNLDKEMPQTERRASWLTTKPLRKPLASNPDAAESSVRELGVRPQHSLDKENVNTESLSEEENVIDSDAPPHPAGVKLRRPGYYTIPSLEELAEYIRPDGSCVVPNFTVGRKNYGNVFYDGEINVANLDLDALVHFLNKEVIVYPEDAEKPPVGQGLNRRAVVTLDRVWPRDKTQRRLIVEPERLLKMDYEGKLRRVCEKHETKFIEYRPESGSWVFRVEHFSKYGLTDSDEEDDPVPDVMKRQLVNQTLQKSAAPAPKPVLAHAAGLGGLGGLSAPPGTSTATEDVFSMQRTTLNLPNGTEKAFEMDTTEHSGEAASLYPDGLAYGVKSPTSELARLEHRHSHSVQLMKASLYSDIADMEEEVSQSSGDQLVPMGGASSAPSICRVEQVSQMAQFEMPVVAPPPTEEVVMRPLIVRPQTVVLKYHRKVPPFNETIAGRLQAACIADMSVCRARHSRVGFGPRRTFAYVSTRDALAELPRAAEQCDIGRYLCGRGDGDWSEPAVVRLAIGHETTGTQSALPKQMESLLEFSECVEDGDCARLVVTTEPNQRRALLAELLRHAQSESNDTYRIQVWKLCEALWAADLENGGVAGVDAQSLVQRNRKLLAWLQEVVSEVTQRELELVARADPLDERDGHSGRVWTLLLGGRTLEACKVARENGDLHMAMLLAQAAGDQTFRSLLEKQLQLWRECGAQELLAKPRLAALQLIAGIRPRGELEKLDWIRALHATARYLCPQVPRLEQIVRTYEGYFRRGVGADGGEEELDLTAVEEDEMGMALPMPPYHNHYSLRTRGDERNHRVLDLRYELLRARAFNCRPRLQPAAHTSDPMDYSLSFVLGCWLGSPSKDSIIGVAEQLEACGHWLRAVQALAYLRDGTARSHLIRGVISRNAAAHAQVADAPAHAQLLRRLGVPRRWLLLAQAHRAKYEHKPLLEAECLVGAEQWNAAHRVLVEELMADAVLSDNMRSIRPLLEKLGAAAQRHEVSGWECGGSALYHYMHVCDEVKDLVSAAEGAAPGASPPAASAAVQGRIEALRPRLAAACAALEKLHPSDCKGAAARAEMGARLVQLAVAGARQPRHLAVMLRALHLPPDCTAHAQLKITSELAEQASEMCIESPLSSHRSPTSARC